MKLNLTYSDELYHYGVKGMKWGVRRSRAVVGQVHVRNSDYEKKLSKREQMINDEHKVLCSKDKKLKKLANRMNKSEAECLRFLTRVDVDFDNNKDFKKARSSYEDSKSKWNRRKNELLRQAEKNVTQSIVNKTVNDAEHIAKIGEYVYKVRKYRIGRELADVL